MTRRAHGESLALIRAALREHPGISSAEVARVTGIERLLASVLLANYRSAGHVESLGPRGQMRWFLASAVRIESPAPIQLVSPARQSVFATRVTPRVDAVAPPRSRVITAEAAAKCYVKPDDFSEGAFMADWKRRTA
jgi:hypothetical protein